MIICRARGDPRPMIKWFKEGAEMQPKSNVHVSNSIFCLKKVGKERHNISVGFRLEYKMPSP